MRQRAIGFGLGLSALAAFPCHGADLPLNEAMAVWHLADAADRAEAQSGLAAEGEVAFGVELADADRDASLLRGGDGKVADFKGGHLVAGLSEALNPQGTALTVAVRLRDPTGRWNGSIFSKHGGHDRLVYNFFSADLNANGKGVDIGFEMATDAGAYSVLLPLSELEQPDAWQDVIARYDGQTLELIVNGKVVDSRPARGQLRQSPQVPCVIGAEATPDNTIAGAFNGQMDHVMLWSRALTDAEIAGLSGKETIVRPERFTERFRPGYHFTPERNFMNDPNGLVFFDGEYHLFFQHNPYGNSWGHMSWGHAVSPDLVTWEHLPIALFEADGVMAYSGSAVVDAGNTSGLGVAEAPPLVALYTGHLAGDRERQDLAFSTDRGRTWTKLPENPVLDLGGKDFRDPKVFWHAPDSRWIMVIAKPDERKVHFYGSANLKTWEKLSEFGPAGAPDKPNWECPDLFPLKVDGEETTKWVLHVGMGDKAAADGSGGEYFIGTFDGTAFQCDDPPEKVRWTDFGKDFYASVSWSDIPAEDGRRIWIGWMSNWQYANDVPTYPWRSAMSVPRTLGLKRIDGELRLTQTPVKELESLRGEAIEAGPIALAAGESKPLDARGDMLEIEAVFVADTATEFGLKVRKGPGEETIVGYDNRDHQVFVDRTRSNGVDVHEKFPGRHGGPLQAEDGRIRLRVFVDRSSVEVFGNAGETTVTDLIFPSPDSQGVEVYAKDGAVTVESIKVWPLRASMSK